MYVRPSYAPLYNKINNKLNLLDKKGMLIVGTPGIGTSHARTQSLASLFTCMLVLLPLPLLVLAG